MLEFRLGNKHPDMARVFESKSEIFAAVNAALNEPSIYDEALALLARRGFDLPIDKLSQDEIAALVAQRELTNDSHHCPHGRPTALLFTRHDLDRQFRRI